MQLRLIFGLPQTKIFRTPVSIGFQEFAGIYIVWVRRLFQTCSRLFQTRSRLFQTRSCVFQTCSRLFQTCSRLFQTRSRLFQTCSSVFQTRSSVFQTCSRLHQTWKRMMKARNNVSIMLIFNQLKEITNPMNRNKIHRTGGIVTNF